MSGVELASGYLSLSASTKGAGADVAKMFAGLTQQAEKAGQDAGKALKKGISTGTGEDVLSGLRAQYNQASQAATVAGKAIADAHTKVEDAARKVGIAEARLTELRDAGNAKSSQLLAAEDRLVASRKASQEAILREVAAIDKSTKAISDAAAASDRLAAAQKGAVVEVDKLEQAIANMSAHAKASIEKIYTKSPFLPMVTHASEVASKIHTTMTELGTKITTPFVTAGTKIRSTLTEAAGKVAAPFEAAASKVSSAFTSAAAKISAPFKGPLEDVAQLTEALTDKIKAKFDGLKSRIGNPFNGLTAHAGTEGTQAGEKFASSFKAKTSALGDSVKAGIAGFAGGVASGLVSTGISFLTDSFKSSIGNASDLAEAGNKVQAIFGPATDSINNFAATASDKMGQTKLQVLDAASTFGVFGKAAGMSTPDLTAFSTKMVGLSTDLASFYNTDPTEATNAISAALRGESEPIRKYGVLLDDTSLKAEAASLGLGKIGATLTPQQRILATQSLIMKQTSLAQGDFAKTSDGLANKQRTLAAKFEELKGSLGEKLLPTVLEFVTFLTDKAIPGVTKFFESPGYNKFSTWIQTVAVPAIVEIGGNIKGLVDTMLPRIKQFVDGMQERLAPMLPGFKAVFDGIGTVVADVVGLLNAIWDRWGTNIMDVTAGIFKYLNDTVGPALRVIQGVIETVTAAINGDWSGAWQGIKKTFSAIWDGISASILENPLSRPFGEMFNATAKVVEGGVNGIIDAWNAIDKLFGAKHQGGHINIPTLSVPALPAPTRAPSGQGFASGGILPGYTPGRDVHHFQSNDGMSLHLSGGEAIMRPEFTDALGPGLINRLNAAAARGGRRAVQGMLGGLEFSFASGGLVDFRGGTFTREFARRLALAEAMAGKTLSIAQGGFRPTTSYSGTSHQGDALDIAPFNVAQIASLRMLGIPTWDRTGKGDWISHAHGIPLPFAGSPAGSAIWQGQDWLHGGDGLGGRDDGPAAIGRMAGVVLDFSKGVINWGETFASSVTKAKESIMGTGYGVFSETLSNAPGMLASNIAASASSLLGFARGTSNAPAGWAWAGEQGPELIRFRGGEQVFTNPQSMAMAGGVSAAELRAALEGLSIDLANGRLFFDQQMSGRLAASRVTARQGAAS